MSFKSPTLGLKGHPEVDGGNVEVKVNSIHWIFGPNSARFHVEFAVVKLLM